MGSARAWGRGSTRLTHGGRRRQFPLRSKVASLHSLRENRRHRRRGAGEDVFRKGPVPNLKMNRNQREKFRRSASVCAVKRLVLAFALLALIASGCGTQAGAGLTEPASIAPANSLAYASFEIAPQGPERENFDAAFGKLLGADPEGQLGAAFTDAASTGGKLDYARDVKPWLGDTVSALVTHVGRDHCDFAVLAASTDDDKAQAAIDKDLAGQN